MKNNIEKKVLSSENIYLAIYSLENSLQNKELIPEEELNRFRDIYNKSDIKEKIEEVQIKIKNILINNDDFLSCNVFFKPKEMDGDKVKFRPIHQFSNMNDAIAAIAMLNVIIYEFRNVCVECKTKDTCNRCDEEDLDKITLSNIGHLIPSNFFGNKISLNPSRIYAPWQQQYAEYTSKASEMFLQFHNTKEYSNEVDIDIVDFFPSIDPRYVISYLMDKLPVYIDTSEKKTIKTILEKLLYIQIKNVNEEHDDLWKNTERGYYRKYDGDLKENSNFFTVGIPQGLIQSYFFANVFMIEVAKVYNEIFNGESIFYVDDSVIFTNVILHDKDEFEKKLTLIENRVSKVVEYYIKRCNLNFNNLDLKRFSTKLKYFIEIHKNDDKSTYTNVLTSKAGEVHLNNLCRAASQTTVDINNSFSDNEDVTLRARVEKMLQEICKEIEYISNIKTEDSFIIQNYKKKLIRYKKFFKYRALILQFREELEFNNIYNKIIEKFIENNKNNQELLNDFFSNFDEDIILPAIMFSIKISKISIDKELIENKIKLIKDYWSRINNELFKFDNKESSYIKQICLNVYDDKEIVTRFNSLNLMVVEKEPGFKIAHDSVRENYINSFLKCDFLQKKKNIFDKDFLEIMSLVLGNTSEVDRDIINCILSNAFNIAFDDSYNFSKSENRMINYKELRLLAYVRNYRFSIDSFSNRVDELINETMEKIDYSLLEVLKCFRLFVKEPDRIDDLIKIHQYTCDIWKNGSKYLYFYTLHNQEHAVQLIKNSIEIVKTINFIKISKLDYYILFIACYLHDISMVTLPSLQIYNNKDSQANSIASEFLYEKDRKSSDSLTIKNLMIKYYKKMDEFYENHVREKHAYKSGQEIRMRKDLEFIELCTREVVAEVAEAHGFDVDEVYKSKSSASERMYSKKFMEIILRLSDLLDISSYRISKPILFNNIDNMSTKSSFHWISHIMTNGYEIKVKYTDDGSNEESDNFESFLIPKRIIENIEIVIHVNISQLTKEEPSSCDKMAMKYDVSNKCRFTLKIGEKCKGDKCNFLCKWIIKKNEYLFNELNELQRYLNDNINNYYDSEISMTVVSKNSINLSQKQFDIIKSEIGW